MENSNIKDSKKEKPLIDFDWENKRITNFNRVKYGQH